MVPFIGDFASTRAVAPARTGIEAARAVTRRRRCTADGDTGAGGARVGRIDVGRVLTRSALDCCANERRRTTVRAVRTKARFACAVRAEGGASLAVGENAGSAFARVSGIAAIWRWCAIGHGRDVTGARRCVLAGVGARGRANVRVARHIGAAALAGLTLAVGSAIGVAGIRRRVAQEIIRARRRRRAAARSVHENWVVRIGVGASAVGIRRRTARAVLDAIWRVRKIRRAVMRAAGRARPAGVILRVIAHRRYAAAGVRVACGAAVRGTNTIARCVCAHAGLLRAYRAADCAAHASIAAAAAVRTRRAVSAGAARGIAAARVAAVAAAVGVAAFGAGTVAAAFDAARARAFGDALTAVAAAVVARVRAVATLLSAGAVDAGFLRFASRIARAGQSASTIGLAPAADAKQACVAVGSDSAGAAICAFFCTR